MSDDRFPVPTSPLHRRSDPETSAASAEAMKGSDALKTGQGRAYYAVFTNPGSTALELARLLGDADPRRVNRRLSELRTAGLVVNAPVGSKHRSKVDPETGRSALRWWDAEEQGRLF